jgi:5-hydroxyisourate hydrolase-like protein (transthyretin family)
MSTLSTHILDISTGKPAEGVTVHLERGTHRGAHRRVRSRSARRPLSAGGGDRRVV